MIKVMIPRILLPVGLIGAFGASFAPPAAAWQLGTPAAGKSTLHGLLTQRALDPPLQGTMTRLRFSPDGKNLLAQDEAGIFVLQREPFGVLFRIDTLEANPANFTPDSQNIVFSTPGLRVETWSVAAKAQKEAHQVSLPRPCLQTALAPNGKVLACLDTAYNLGLFDVTSSLPVFEKKAFYPAATASLVAVVRGQERVAQTGEWQPDWVYMGFSPDSRYFVASQRAASPSGAVIQEDEDTALAVDLTSRTPVRIPDAMRPLLAGGFAFVAPDRLAAEDLAAPLRSAVLTFPAGKILHRLFLEGRLEAATSADFILIRPATEDKVGVYDLTDGRFVVGTKTSAIDAYADLVVIEDHFGELSLYSPQDRHTVAKLLLPRKPLAALAAAAVSPDLQCLAISERTAGGIWDLSGKKRGVDTFGFRGVFFDRDGLMYAEFLKDAKSNHGIVRADFITGASIEVAPITDDHARQDGPFVLIRQPATTLGPFVSDASLTVRDVRSYKILWNRSFPGGEPGVWTTPDTGLIVFGWPATSAEVQDAVQHDAALGQRLSAWKDKTNVCLLEVLDGWTGKLKGRLFVEAGPGLAGISRIVASGDLVLVGDTESRVEVYSLSRGATRGEIHGIRPVVSSATSLVLVQTEPRQLDLYSLATLEKRDEYTFVHPISFAAFSGDGKRLFVLTNDQTVFILDVSGAAK